MVLVQCRSCWLPWCFSSEQECTFETIIWQSPFIRVLEHGRVMNEIKLCMYATGAHLAHSCPWVAFPPWVWSWAGVEQTQLQRDVGMMVALPQQQLSCPAEIFFTCTASCAEAETNPGAQIQETQLWRVRERGWAYLCLVWSGHWLH